MSDIFADKIYLTDSGVPPSGASLYSTSGNLYYNGSLIFPLAGQQNNSIISVKVPVTSGISGQQIYFPFSYPCTPHISYSVISTGSGNPIISSQVTSLTDDSVTIAFTSGIPNFNYYLDLMVFPDASGVFALFVSGLINVTNTTINNEYTTIISGGSGMGGGGGNTPYYIISDNSSCQPFDRIIADSTVSPFTIILPTSSGGGAWIELIDGECTWGVNNVIISGLVSGDSDGLTLNTPNRRVLLVDIGGSIGYCAIA